MLKLERNNNGMGISIGIRGRDKWFSRFLLMGLTIALVLHGSAILLFNIQPFRVHYSRTPQVPALVDTDLTVLEEPEQQIYALLEEEKKRRRYTLMPPSSHPTLPQMVLPAHSAAPLLTYESHLAVETFESLEKEARQATETIQEMLIPATSVRLSGGLYGRTLNWKPPKPSLIPETANTLHYVADIQIDEENGTIFWFAPQSIQGDADLIGHAEKMIEELSLVPLNEKTITRGTIEINLYRT